MLIPEILRTLGSWISWTGQQPELLDPGVSTSGFHGLCTVARFNKHLYIYE